MTRSVFYNLASEEGERALGRLRELGHRIGLHAVHPHVDHDGRFDAVLAWHNPDPDFMREPVDGLVNVMQAASSTRPLPLRLEPALAQRLPARGARPRRFRVAPAADPSRRSGPTRARRWARRCARCSTRSATGGSSSCARTGSTLTCAGSAGSSRSTGRRSASWRARWRSSSPTAAPTASGVCAGDGVALGSRRLAIIDLSDAGLQPFASEDGRLQLVYNGEVYNYRELRRELEALGHRFRTATDTEVVAPRLPRVGRRAASSASTACGRSRSGTPPSARLFCSRDRFGVKPFYYRVDGGRLAFASEPKAFRADR